MRRSAFTIVELLVAISIIGSLIGLLLPAVQMARESARLSQCANNLRHVSVALLTHQDQSGTFPYGGWGHEWIGVSNRGVRDRQPGSWIYDILPLIEQQSLHDVAAPGSRIGAARLLATPVGLFTCPTRRPCRLWPISSLFPYMQNAKPDGASIEMVARSDYAINAGATLAFSFPGPPDIAAGDSNTFSWPPMTSPTTDPLLDFSGISHLRCASSLKSIADGASNTYLIGEKMLSPDQYENGESMGDNESMYSGYCTDNHRFTRAGKINLPPAQDTFVALAMPSQLYFGSAHASGANFAFCDGSVRLVAFDVSPDIHFRAGHIADGGAPGL